MNSGGSNFFDDTVELFDRFMQRMSFKMFGSYIEVSVLSGCRLKELKLAYSMHLKY